MQESHFMRYDPEHFLAKKGLAHPLHSHKNSFMGNEDFATSTCGGIDWLMMQCMRSENSVLVYLATVVVRAAIKLTADPSGSTEGGSSSSVVLRVRGFCQKD